ncbi:hypothetical protein [Longimicrobium sp.]|uniref:hypothetical protein n=1 Tax=Longimicrobium sp. TaxID=2029185 RepID=UPI002E341072|nr:hypothetical protein [Longimicrobium sp.]HEX6040292.1 hypothetical protein [Longimicrobium sp.]
MIHAEMGQLLDAEYERHSALKTDFLTLLGRLAYDEPDAAARLLATLQKGPEGPVYGDKGQSYARVAEELGKWIEFAAPLQVHAKANSQPDLVEPGTAHAYPALARLDARAGELTALVIDGVEDAWEKGVDKDKLRDHVWALLAGEPARERVFDPWTPAETVEQVELAVARWRAEDDARWAAEQQKQQATHRATPRQEDEAAGAEDYASFLAWLETLKTPATQAAADAAPGEEVAGSAESVSAPRPRSRGPRASNAAALLEERTRSELPARRARRVA